MVVAWQRVGEMHVPMHAAAKRLVLRMPATAQTVVLSRRAHIAGHGISMPIRQRDPTGDAVRSVLRDLDCWLSNRVDLVACFAPVNRIGQGAGRACSDGTNDVVHSSAAR